MSYSAISSFKRQKFYCIFILIGLWFSLSGCGEKKEQTHEFTNRLIDETSPYLIQHAHNPVDWYPWGDEALQKAKEEDKLIVISIGYSSCHWCHVMEHESFEDTSVANYMNDNFISIKIDREERPDIDQIYMDAAILVNGRGGWPLNIVALPDTRPVFAGTYYPKEDWTNMLEFFQNVYETEPEKLVNQADLITKGINNIEEIPEIAVSEFNKEEINKLASSTLDEMDFTFGGKNGLQKFPTPSLYQFMLEQYKYTDNDSLLEAVEILLDNMAKGGIYDQLGSGFARYSTDEEWFAPHFEKMLYDNGQLVSLYSNAYKITKKKPYKTVIEETLNFIERELTNPEGAFYSSIDADSEGEEGTFYVWSVQEIDSILDDSEVFKKHFGVLEEGNWEPNRNILSIEEPIEKLAEEYQVIEEELSSKIETQKKQLFEVREKRIKPGTDDKILTSWNALMILGYLDAHEALGNEKYLESALKAGKFILKYQKKDDGGLFRNHKDGESAINAFLDDYTFTIEAFLALYQSTFDITWLNEAKQLTEYVLQNFKDEKTGLFFYTNSKDRSLIARKKELNDSVLPSSNSSMAKNLFTLGTLLYNKEYLEQSKIMLGKVFSDTKQSPVYFFNWASLAGFIANPFYEIAVVGEDHQQKVLELAKNYIPNAIYLGGKEEGELELLENKLIEGKTMIYVCLDKSCRLPTEEVEKALTLIE